MKRKIPLLLLSLIFLSMTGYSGYQLLMEYREYKAGEEAYDSLSQYIQLAEPLPSEAELIDPSEAVLDTAESIADTLPTEMPKTDSIIWPVIDFEALQDVNPDVVAWIYLEGTVINYPVVQGSDNSEYLNKLVDGTSNGAGSIFMDYRNQPDFTGRNTVLYGHNMQNKTMFGTLANYKEQSYYDAHPTCLILTPEGNYTLEFFSGFVVDLNSDVWKLEFESDEEYGAWQEQAMASSTFQSEVYPTPQDRVVTLTTCSYDQMDARYVLLGILTPQS